MARLEADSLARLQAMGISVWERRQTGPVEAAAVTAQLADSNDGVRIRLASGEGEWLLVQRQPWGGNPDTILDDIRACLGPARCRFGQWAVGSPAGEDSTELAERGVKHILSFGPSPGGDWSGLVEAPSLAELAADWRARRALWQQLRPLLGEH
ncbi:MAG: hypothetical protein EA370_03535 [Wenzhouxiangella sp.]|nr:MAG: hypothetical protein EA370_03535 [Wenzhouxiangella sp.]